MKIYDNGVYRNASKEEEASIQRIWADNAADIPVPTAEERLDALEAAIKEGLQL